MLTLGRLLKQKRESLGLTVREVGEEINLSYSLVSRFEKGSRIPSAVILQRLQNVLKMDDYEFSQLLQLRTKNETLSVEQKGGVNIQWIIIEAIKEFKSIYPII